MENSSETIYGVLNGTKEISDVIKKTQFENLDIITSNAVSYTHLTLPTTPYV